MWIPTWSEESDEATPLPWKLLINSFYFKIIFILLSYFILILFLFLLIYIYFKFFRGFFFFTELQHEASVIDDSSGMSCCCSQCWWPPTLQQLLFHHGKSLMTPQPTPKGLWAWLTPTADRSTTTPKSWQKVALDRVNTAQFLSFLGMLCVIVGEAREFRMVKAFKRLQCLLD